MKKILFSLFILLIFSLKVDALDYSCSIDSQKDYFTVYQENALETEMYTPININIENIDNISQLRLYVKYDNQKYEVNACKFLSYTTTCSYTYKNDSIIYYDYQYSDTYKVRDFPFFYVNFLSNKNTPKKGNTKIEVYFEDAKDKDGNKININSCSKTFDFREEEITTEIVPVVESNKDIDVLISGYDFIFDKDTYEYNLNVDKDVTSLDVKVLVSDEYEYTLTGASDLNTYGNKILIVITDSENNEKTYTINVIKEKTEVKNKDIETNIKKKIKNTNYKKYIPHVIIILVSLIVLIIIIRKLTSRKIDKYLDKL